MTKSKSKSSSDEKNHDPCGHKWAMEEDIVLPDLVLKYGCHQWEVIAKELTNTFAHVISYVPRTAIMCQARWKRILTQGKKRGHWSMQEDQLILYGIQKVSQYFYS